MLEIGTNQHWIVHLIRRHDVEQGQFAELSRRCGA
jgi:hypothetical protein